MSAVADNRGCCIFESPAQCDMMQAYMSVDSCQRKLTVNALNWIKSDQGLLFPYEISAKTDRRDKENGEPEHTIGE